MFQNTLVCHVLVHVFCLGRVEKKAEKKEEEKKKGQNRIRRAAACSCRIVEMRQDQREKKGRGKKGRFNPPCKIHEQFRKIFQEWLRRGGGAGKKKGGEGISLLFPSDKAAFTDAGKREEGGGGGEKKGKRVFVLKININIVQSYTVKCPVPGLQTIGYSKEGRREEEEKTSSPPYFFFFPSAVWRGKEEERISFIHFFNII